MPHKKLFGGENFWRQKEAKSAMDHIADIGLLPSAYDTDMPNSSQNRIFLYNRTSDVLVLLQEPILHLNSQPQMVKMNGTNLFHVIQIHDKLRKGGARIVIEHPVSICLKMPHRAGPSIR